MEGQKQKPEMKLEMEFGMDKCALLRMKKNKIGKTVGMQLQDGTFII